MTYVVLDHMKLIVREQSKDNLTLNSVLDFKEILIELTHLFI